MSSVGDKIDAGNARWSFGGNVAESFDSHVEKSVPLYHEGHELIAKISDFFLHDGSVCYEIGSSTGALTCMLAERHADTDVHYVGLDNQDSMSKYAQKRAEGIDRNIEFKTTDVLDFDFEPCDLVVAYYTVQFILPKHRQTLINTIYESLNWGGSFLLFEKVRACDARFQDISTAVYTDYKLEQGYSPDEIVGKARSLKGVLEPFSTEGNLGLLNRAGFVDVVSVFKYMCFEGFLAIK